MGWSAWGRKENCYNCFHGAKTFDKIKAIFSTSVCYSLSLSLSPSLSLSHTHILTLPSAHSWKTHTWTHSLIHSHSPTLTHTHTHTHKLAQYTFTHICSKIEKQTTVAHLTNSYSVFLNVLSIYVIEFSEHWIKFQLILNFLDCGSVFLAALTLSIQFSRCVLHSLSVSSQCRFYLKALNYDVKTLKSIWYFYYCSDPAT